MHYQNVHKKVSRIGYIVIWMVSLLIPLIKFILTLPQVNVSYGVMFIFMIIESFGLVALPTLLTIMLYGILLCYINRHTTTAEGTIMKQPSTETTKNQMKALAKMTHGVVVGVIFCNVPGLIFGAYAFTMWGQARGEELFKSNIEV